MRIHSSFRDYYDSIQSFDEDDIFYLRKSMIVKLKSVLKQRIFTRGRSFSIDSKQLIKKILPLGYNEMIVGFCGKIYPLIELIYKEKLDGNVSSIIKSIFFYDQKELDSFLIDMKLRFPERNSYAEILELYGDYFETFTNRLSEKKDLFSLFTQLQVPIFLIREDPLRKDWEDTKYCFYDMVIETNPCLERLSFQKVIDPFSAFQEISMYLGGVLGRPERPTVDISDQFKIQQHGFDKLSFRTMKGDKKPRKANRGKK